MYTKKKILLVLSSILIFILGGMFLLRKQQTRTPIITSEEKAGTVSIVAPTIQSMEDREKNYFSEEILPKYPRLMSEVDPTKIVRVFPIALRYFSDGGTAYLVQVDDDVATYSFYLVTPLVQKKLDHPMTAYDGNDARCTVLRVLPVDRAEYLATSPYPNNRSYFLISGNECTAYSGGEFTSMYDLKTGEKIKFSRPPAVSKLYFPEVNSEGNVNGTLDGVYGEPMTIVVQTHFIGYDRSYVFFDFVTGRFKQAVRL